VDTLSIWTVNYKLVNMNFISFKCITLILSFAVLTSGLPYAEDIDYDYDAANSDVSGEDTAADIDAAKGADTVVPDTPQFITSSQSVLVNEGDTLRLPCLVDRLEGFIMLWKKNGNIITVASQIIDKRVRLDEEVNGNHLVIGQATPEDSGEYTCQISAFTPTEITHKVIIRVKPDITTTPEDVLIANAGSEAILECNIVSGTPTPEVRWRRKEGKLPSGEEELVGSTLTFSEVTKHDAGHYVCLADNGFGPSPVQKEVSLEVHYAPEIEVEESYIVTDMEEEQEIACIVHSSPQAEVTWTVNGETLEDEPANIVLSQNQNRYSLLILSVSNESVGEYSCIATNSIGEATATTAISGDAQPAVIISPHVSDDPHAFTLEWSAESESEIEQFEVAVRKEGESEWKLHNVIVNLNSNETADNNATDRDNEYQADLKLTELEPATRYEVTVASKNKFGLSSHGDLFSFATKGADPAPVKPVTEKQTPVQQPSVLTSDSTELKPFVTFFLLSLLALRL